MAVFAESYVVWNVLFGLDIVKWQALFGIFLLFLMVSIYNVFIGKQSCGCAGAIEIPPIAVGIFDLVVVGLLWSFGALRRDALDSKSIKNCSQSKFFGTTFGCIVGVGLFVFAQSSYVESTFSSIGSATLVRTTVSDFGVQKVGSEIPVTIKLKNLTSIPLSIIGIQRSCSCIRSSHRPIAIPPDGEALVDFVVHSKNAGKFHQRVVFYTDSKRQFSFAEDIFGFLEE